MPRGRRSGKKRKKRENEVEQNNYVQASKEKENENKTEKETKNTTQAEENWDDELLNPGEHSQWTDFTQEESGEACQPLTSTSHAGNSYEIQTLNPAGTVPGDEPSNVTQDTANFDKKKVNMNFYSKLKLKQLEVYASLCSFSSEYNLENI